MEAGWRWCQGGAGWGGVGEAEEFFGQWRNWFMLESKGWMKKRWDGDGGGEAG